MVQARDLTTRRQVGDAARRRGAGARPGWPVLAAFLAPAFGLYTLFVVYPMLSALQYSFFRWRGTARAGFAGFANYQDLFTVHGEQLGRAFWHNCLIFAGAMLVQNTLGLLFAVLLHRNRFGRRFFQTAYTLPYLINPLVIGLLWKLLLSDYFGVNVVLREAGLGGLALNWLGRPELALPVEIAIFTWAWVGIPMLLFGAALAGIPEEYGEAARVDGASSWQVFRHVTLPLLTPAIGLVSVITFVDTFNLFGLAFGLGGENGDPAYGTDVLGLLFYRMAWRADGEVNAIGPSSALAVLMFVFVFGISLLTLRMLRKREERLS